MRIGADKPRMGARLKTPAAQQRDGEITVFVTLFARQVCAGSLARHGPVNWQSQGGRREAHQPGT